MTLRGDISKSGSCVVKSTAAMCRLQWGGSQDTVGVVDEESDGGNRSTDGLRPGTLQDLPTGGGARAYLFIVTTTDEIRGVGFYSNTGNAHTSLSPAMVDKEFFQAQGLIARQLSLGPILAISSG